MGDLIFKMKNVWCDVLHVIGMVHTDEVNFIGANKETMLLDRGRHVPVEHLIKTEPKELYINEDGVVLWRGCAFGNEFIEQAKRILNELSHDGCLSYYMPERGMAMAIVSDNFTIFIAPRLYLSNIDTPLALAPPILPAELYEPEESP
jgi:hypothetical protein